MVYGWCVVGDAAATRRTRDWRSCVGCVCGTERWSISFYCSSPLFPPAQTHLSRSLSLARVVRPNYHPCVHARDSRRVSSRNTNYPSYYLLHHQCIESLDHSCEHARSKSTRVPRRWRIYNDSNGIALSLLLLLGVLPPRAQPPRARLRPHALLQRERPLLHAYRSCATRFEHGATSTTAWQPRPSPTKSTTRSMPNS